MLEVHLAVVFFFNVSISAKVCCSNKMPPALKMCLTIGRDIHPDNKYCEFSVSIWSFRDFHIVCWFFLHMSFDAVD